MEKTGLFDILPLLHRNDTPYDLQISVSASLASLVKPMSQESQAEIVARLKEFLCGVCWEAYSGVVARV